MRWRDIPFHPPSKTLRWFAGYAFVAFVAASAWQYCVGHEMTALVGLAAALVLVVFSLFRPMWLRPVFVAALIVTFPLGWLISHMLLCVIFFGIFTPLGVLFRLVGRDPLGLRFEREYKSYWREKPAAPDTRSYFRQS